VCPCVRPLRFTVAIQERALRSAGAPPTFFPLTLPFPPASSSHPPSRPWVPCSRPDLSLRCPAQELVSIGPFTVETRLGE
jgi:hypothetical protein